MRKTLVASVVAAFSVIVALPLAAPGYNRHLCGLKGTVLSYQESCPGISPAKKWRRVTAYRTSKSGIDMCIIVRNRKGKYLFSRCSFYATSIYIPPKDMNGGRQYTRVYNKNNNATLGQERRWLYASTK